MSVNSRLSFLSTDSNLIFLINLSTKSFLCYKPTYWLNLTSSKLSPKILGFSFYKPSSKPTLLFLHKPSLSSCKLTHTTLGIWYIDKSGSSFYLGAEEFHQQAFTTLPNLQEHHCFSTSLFGSTLGGVHINLFRSDQSTSFSNWTFEMDFWRNVLCLLLLV